MFVTYPEYVGFGYNLIPEADFKRYIYKAGHMVQTLTLDRVNDDWLNPLIKPTDPATLQLIYRNKRGICELAELVFRRDTKPLGEAGVEITSFKNEGYSETFASTSNLDALQVFEQNVSDTMSIYFSRAQLYRRVTANAWS